VASSRVRRISTRTVVGLVAAIAAADVITTRLAPPHSEALLKVVILIGFVWWARRFAGLSWGELGLARANLGAGVRVGGLAALVIAAAIVVLVAVPGSRSYFDNHDVAADSTTERVLEPLVVIPLGTVVFEETIFRGVLLGVLLRVGSRRCRRRDVSGVRVLARRRR
jgi:membrane protease YdiL (CAAX protease family)